MGINHSSNREYYCTIIYLIHVCRLQMCEICMQLVGVHCLTFCGVACFFSYYDILPKTLRNIPIFWTDDEFKYLEGSYLLTQINDRIDAITEDYYSICQVAPQLQEIASLEEFKWARMCVCSRNFGLQIDGHRTSALVPHADMLNHHRPRETKWSFDDELQAFTITT